MVSYEYVLAKQIILDQKKRLKHRASSISDYVHQIEILSVF